MYKEYCKTRRLGSGKEGASVGRILSPLPSNPPTNGSVERKRSEKPVIVEPDLETEAAIMVEIERRMSQVQLCQNRSCQACLNDFIYIASKIEHYYDSVTQKLLEIGFLEIFQQVLRQHLEKAIADADGKSFNASMFAVLVTCSTAIIMTDVSCEGCRKVIQLELHVDIINSLKSDQLNPRQKKQPLSPTLCELVDELMSVLYNVVQLITEEAKELYREQGIIEVIQRFRTGTSNSLSCFALMLLSWVTSDKENSLLNSNDEDFSFLSEELKSSLDKISRRSEYGHKTVEILTVINKLIVNDSSKKQFFKSGVLSSYVMLLEPRFDPEEQSLAVQGLWTLALKHAEEIKREETCVAKLELLSKKSEHEGVRIKANGALIALGVKQDQKSHPKKTKQAAEDSRANRK